MRKFSQKSILILEKHICFNEKMHFIVMKYLSHLKLSHNSWCFYFDKHIPWAFRDPSVMLLLLLLSPMWDVEYGGCRVDYYNNNYVFKLNSNAAVFMRCSLSLIFQTPLVILSQSFFSKFNSLIQTVGLYYLLIIYSNFRRMDTGTDCNINIYI